MATSFPRSTVVDVAAAAGVSACTVSNAFRHPERLAPRTRERVLRAAEAVDYSPNLVARSLRGRVIRAVGFVGDLGDVITRCALPEIEFCADQTGLIVQVLQPAAGRSEDRCLRIFGEVGVRDVVLPGRCRPPEAAAAARAAVLSLLQVKPCAFHPDASRLVVLEEPTIVVCTACC